MFVSRIATLHDVRKCIPTIFCSLLLFWGILHDLYIFPFETSVQLLFFCLEKNSPLSQNAESSVFGAGEKNIN